jgi:hypothetical protein
VEDGRSRRDRKGIRQQARNARRRQRAAALEAELETDERRTVEREDCRCEREGRAARGRFREDRVAFIGLANDEEGYGPAEAQPPPAASRAWWSF